MVAIKSILEKLDPDLPGVYRFIGFNQLTGESNRSLYVGKSGDKKPVWDYYQTGGIVKRPQMLKKRIRRHLDNDAGMLNMIIDDIKYLEKLEYWPVDPRDFSDFIKFQSCIQYLEYYVRDLTDDFPYYNRVIKTKPSEIRVDEDIKKIAIKIYADKKEIEFSYLTESEKQFLRCFNIIASSPIRDHIKWRRYNQVSKIMEMFIKSWNELDKVDYFWEKFENID